MSRRFGHIRDDDERDGHVMLMSRTVTVMTMFIVVMMMMILKNVAGMS